MTFPIDFWQHPKVARLSDSAFRAFVESNGHSRMIESDGRLEAEDAEFLWDKEALEALVKSHPTRPLMLREDNTYVLRDYAEHQFTKADRDELAEKRSDAGKRGAAKRWGGMANAKQTVTDAKQTDGKPWLGKEIGIGKEITTTTPSVSESEFDSAYSHWPKKINRKQAFERFKTAVKKRDKDLLLADIVRFGDAYARTTETKYVPALGVWLNGERWTDELPGAPVTQVGPQKKRFVAYDD